MSTVSKRYKVSILTLIRVGKLTYEQAVAQVPGSATGTRAKWKRAQELLDLRTREMMERVEREKREKKEKREKREGSGA